LDIWRQLRIDGLALSAAAYAAAVADLAIQDSAFAAPLAVPFDDPAPFAAAYAAAAADPDVRMEIRFDASALQRLGVRWLTDLPLWREIPPGWWKDGWQRLKAALPNDEDWDVWIDWYEERLLGGSRGEGYELVFARAPQQVWEKGPAAANAWIKAHLPRDSGSPSLPNRPKPLPKRM
jgi:broad specificity phosphatase PhoE